MIPETRVLKLIQKAYEAAEDDAAWPSFLEHLGDIFGGAACGVTVHSPKVRLTRMAISVRLSPDDANAYAAYYHQIDLFTSLGSAALAKTSVAASHMYLEDRVLIRSEYFNDFLRKQNLFYNMVCSLRGTNGSSAYLTILRSQKAGEFNESEQKLLEVLAPHFRHAAHLHQRLNTSYSLDSALHYSGHGYLFVDSSCNILFSNDAATAILEEQDGLSMCDKRLTLTLKLQNRELLKLCAAADDPLQKAGTLKERLMAATRISGKRPYLLRISPLRASNLATLLGAATAVITIVDPEAETGLDPDCLSVVFGLTPTETNIAGMLINGEDLTKIAERLSVTRNTVRTHLRSIFEKTGVKRQAQLVSLASRFRE